MLFTGINREQRYQTDLDCRSADAALNQRTSDKISDAELRNEMKSSRITIHFSVGIPVRRKFPTNA
jgi:hypothetical protein